MFISIPSAAIAVILLLCAAFWVVSYYRSIIKTQHKSIVLLREMYDKSFQRQLDIRGEIPYYQFILGDIETGWVWNELFDSLKQLNIGDTITLKQGNVDGCFKVSTFNGIRQYKDYTPVLSFNVEAVTK